MSLPRFKLEENYDMKGVLSSLGLTDALEEGKAGFSGMSSRRDLDLSQTAQVLCEGQRGGHAGHRGRGRHCSRPDASMRKHHARVLC